MSIEQLAAWSQVVASAAVVVSLVFVAWEVRMGTRVARATARKDLSHFAFEISQFNSAHADRLAKVHDASATNLSPGDVQFRFWAHVQFLLHGETFFMHHKLGLLPQSHWDAYCNFFGGYVATPGFADAWDQMRKSFQPGFGSWVEAHLAALKPPVHAPNG